MRFLNLRTINNKLRRTSFDSRVTHSYRANDQRPTPASSPISRDDSMSPTSRHRDSMSSALAENRRTLLYVTFVPTSRNKFYTFNSYQNSITGKYHDELKWYIENSIFDSYIEKLKDFKSVFCESLYHYIKIPFALVLKNASGIVYCFDIRHIPLKTQSLNFILFYSCL